MSSPITKELLEELTGCQVLNFSVEGGQAAGDGYLSAMYSVKVDLISSKNEPSTQKESRHFLFKCIPSDAARHSYLRTSNMFYGEFTFYKIWVKVLHDFIQTQDLGSSEKDMLALSVAPFIGGRAIDYSTWGEKDHDEAEKVSKNNPLDNFVVMTDLRSLGFRMVEKTAGLDFDHLTLAFTELAKMHALSWIFRNKVEWDLLKKFPCLRGQWDRKKIHDVWVKVVGSSIETAAVTIDGVLGEGNEISKSTREFEGKLEKVVKFFLEQNEDVEKEAWKLHRNPPKDMVEASENEELWRVQLHGDTRGNNLLFKYDSSGKPERVILVDLQQSRQGCPTADLINLVYSVTTAKFRKAHMDTLLQLYCDKFTEYCNLFKAPLLPGFSFAALKRKFHKAKVSGCMLAILLFPMIFMDNSKEVNMEEAGNDTSIEDMVTTNYKEDALENMLYRERMLELAQDLYDEGVI